MTRNKMIDLLVTNHILDIILCRDYYSLEDILCLGWKGYEKYTDEELKEAIDGPDLDEEDMMTQLKKVKKQIKKDLKETQESIDAFWKDK